MTRVVIETHDADVIIESRLARVVVAGALAAALGVAAPPARAAAPPEPPSPVSGPVSHPARDGGRAGAVARSAARPTLLPTQPRGIDVSGYQGVVDWIAARAGGAQFAYVKATEGTTYRSPEFGRQYGGAGQVGLLRGAYHFALPDRTSAVEQATFFLANGGTWTPDGQTLPPMIDIEDNPYGPQCYGLDAGRMSAWLAQFSETVRQRTGRVPTIYTSTRWWRACTGDNPTFGANPLFLARYDDEPGPMPASWRKEAIWQYSDGGDLPGDQDVVRGSRADLEALAAAPRP